MRRATACTGTCVAGFLAACGGGSAPRWADVVAAAEEVSSSVERGEHVLPDGRTVRVSTDGASVRLALALAANDWVERAPGFWLAELALPLPKDDRTNASVFELADASGGGARSFTMLPYRVLEKGDGQERFPPFSFRVGRKGLLLRLPKGERPAAETTLTHVTRAATRSVWGPHFSGRGFQVWPGQTLRLVVDVPEGAVLRFATALDPLEQVGESEPPTIFRVLQEGEPVFEHAVAAPTQPVHDWHHVELLRTGRRSELAFRVEGAFANTSFLAPVLGPHEIGAPGRRPWSDRRPDIVVFLADTFRADAMRAYGGELGLTPNLDRIAGESLLFRRAWSVGTFTLPAHAALFSGLMPMQAGVLNSTNAVPDELSMIAELLSAAGYRTGAITGSGFVSRRFGFAQGFDFFHEDSRDLATFDFTERATGASAADAGRDAGGRWTVAAACEAAERFLDADDGRPLFLFVHTYLTHKPYLVSAETRQRLGIRGDFAEIEVRLRAAIGDSVRLPDDAARAESVLAIVRETQAHYRGVVADLDRDLGVFHRALERRGWFEHGWLVFTSDHGEAFGEHGEVTHGGTVFEEMTRIPLLIQGMGTEARVVDESASLVDLTPTLADMAGLRPRPEWVGTSLLELARDRPVFSYGLGKESTIAVVVGSHKVIGFETGGAVDVQRVLGAFDLVLDPGERTNLAEERASWADEMLRAFAPELERTFVPVVTVREAQLDAGDVEELRDLGYGFDE